MRDKVNVLYYPDYWVDHSTLKKTILLFDELHFMDRPSMMFHAGPGQFGTIGAQSPLREYEASFREEGVPLFVHSAPMGPVEDEWYDAIKADVNDREFLCRFQNGLRTSPTFRNLQISPGNYGEFGDQDSVAQRMIAVDLSADMNAHESPIALFEDSGIKHFNLSNPVGCAKYLIAGAVTCSATLNFALNTGMKQGLFPLADAKPYGDLLGAKYARAISALGSAKNKIQVTDLSFAILDELIPKESLDKLKLIDVVRYRNESEKAREEFLEYLSVIQAKQASIGIEGDYAGTLNRLVTNEIVPAARTFKNKLMMIHESLFGALGKGALGFLGTSPAAVSIFGELSWRTLLPLAGAAGAYIGKTAIDAFLAERAARRECSISYLLALDK